MIANSIAILERLSGDGRFRYQCAPAEKLAEALDTHRGALDASGMGVGKTAVGVAVPLLLGRRMAVVCPAACIEGWQRMALHFGVEPVFVLSYEMVRGGRTAFYNARTGWTLDKDIVLIWDEAHAAKGGESTDNGKALAASWRHRLHVLMISATIAENPAEMWSSGQVLGLHDGTKYGFERWIQQHGCRWSEAFDKWMFPKEQRHRLAAINERIFGGAVPRGIRITTEELGDAFPPSDIQFVEVEMPDDVTARIRAIWAECNTFCKRFEAQKARSWTITKIKRGAWARAYEASQTAKTGWLTAEIPQRIAEGYSVPVFTNYTSTREAVMAGLGTKCGIYGGQSAKARERHRLDFQQDRERNIIAQIQSGGTGLDLHDVESKFPRYAYILPCAKWSLIQQATGRVRRAGGGPSIQRILFAAGTVEARICQKARERIANMKMIVEGEQDLVLEGESE